MGWEPERLTLRLFRGLLTVLLLAQPAAAQSLEEGRSWIHTNGRDCCPHRNCYPAPNATLTRDGWQVPGMTGRISPFAGRDWPYPETWACYYPQDPAKTLRCVFHPRREESSAAIILVSKGEWRAEAQEPMQNCKSRDEMVRFLTERFGEIFQAAGSSREGQVELWRSRGGRTWSLLIRKPDGTYCPLAWGENWLQR